MRYLRQKLGPHLRFRTAACLVLAVALVPTGIAYWRVCTNVRFRDEARFNAIAGKAEETIRNNLESLTADLLALSGFFEAKGAVRREEWNAFIAKLELERRHPGLRSVGFAERVEAESSGVFVERMRREARPDYDIFPRPIGGLAFPTVYVTQFPTNIDARLGWDAYSEPHRRVALDLGMAHRGPTVTGKTSYWNKEGPSEGFTIFVPVRRLGATNGAVAGFVFSSFIPQYLFDSAAGRRLDSSASVELFDGGVAQPSALLGSVGTGADLGGGRASFSRDVLIRLLDHVFLLRVATLPEFDTLSERHLPLAVLTAALAFAFLLFGITWHQGSARAASENLNRRLSESQEQLRTANLELKQRMAEARTAEELLAHERDLLRRLLDHSPDRIYFKDRASRFIKCSQAVVGHLGLDASTAAAGKTDFDFFSEEHARAAFEMEQEIIRTGQPAVGVVEKETWPDGHETWVLTSKMPMRDQEGTIVGTFGISKDITRLKATELALAKEKELLAVTLRSIGDGVVTTDAEGRIVLFNEVAERLTGWTCAEAVGQPLEEAFRIRRRDDGSAPEPGVDSVLCARDGTARNIAHSIAPIIDRSGQRLGGAVLVFRDVTDQLKTQVELEKASKLESVGVLAGGIAHDFNNILTVILGNISLARMMAADARSVTQSLEEAERASLRARELTQRLLTFAKGGAPIKKPIDLSPVVRGCATRALQGAEIRPRFFIGDDLWPVEADEAQISQVVQNIIGHARTAPTQDARIDIHVLNQELVSDPLLLVKPGKYVRVSIRDYGTAVQPEQLTKIFDPYFGGRKQGHGLELATAYSIVRKHDGQIRVESSAGQGTVFHIYLPAVPEAPASAAPVRRALPRDQVRPRHVLVMDDELPVRKLAALLLQCIGHSCVTAADGAEALEHYETARRNGRPFDAVIMDLTVPHGMGGQEAMQRLKAIDPAVRAIVSSGYSNDPVMANFRDHGFSGVVPKPYSTEDLADVLEQLFAKDPSAPAVRA